MPALNAAKGLCALPPGCQVVEVAREVAVIMLAALASASPVRASVQKEFTHADASRRLPKPHKLHLMPRSRKLRLRHFATLALTLVSLVSGCRPAPLAYHLVPWSPNALLLPPNQYININANAPLFDLTIKNARQAKGSPANCDIAGDLITLHWQGKTANVKLKSESYVVTPESGAANRGSQRLFLDPLLSIEKFRNDLENLETNGCLRPGESRLLNIALSEKLPLPAGAGYRFRFGSFELTGIVDLVSDFRLNVDGPVYSAVANDGANNGANDSTKQVIGYERAYYIFSPAGKSDRTQISLASVTETDIGKAALPKSKPQNALSLPESPGYFRLVLRSSAAATENISIATLLSAPDEKTLSDATRQLTSKPEEACEAVTARGANCMVFPPRVGVGIELGVHVNGRQVFVGLGGWLDDTVKGANSLAVIEKTLQVRRLYQGHLIPIKFDPASQSIFALVLMPGDEITW
jgi:hypothetical protein